jgi:hypothetical protein
MTANHRASIIISSYNYGRFLDQTIQSALNQTHSNTEVIVVDDGSTDNSRRTIAQYGNRIVPVLKTNGGQASALNAGFERSQGKAILFLDSDDLLLPTAVAKSVEILADGETVKVHLPLLAIDDRGKSLDKVICPNPAEGDLREDVIRRGPRSYAWPPTSGNAWSRHFVERVFPMPEEEYRVSPDLYLHALAPLFGPVRRLLQPQACWRVHGENRTFEGSFDDKVGRSIEVWDHTCKVLSDHCRKMGVHVDPRTWTADSWFYPLRTAIREITALVPPGDTFILVDQSRWGTDQFVNGRRRIPFLERDGQYWGAPPDDTTAIQELERLRANGANFLVFGWPAFWWLDVYAGLHEHLRSTSRRVLKTQRVIVFDLRV